MNNTQMKNQIVKMFDSIKADKNGNITVAGRLSFNKSGGLSTKMYYQAAVSFFREYRRNLLHNGSSVNFEHLCSTLAEKVDFDQILAYRFTKTGEKNGVPIYTKVTFNAEERRERIKSFSKRIKQNFSPAFGWNLAATNGVNLSVADMEEIIKSAARMVTRVANPYVAPQPTVKVVKPAEKKAKTTTTKSRKPAATVAA